MPNSTQGSLDQRISVLEREMSSMARAQTELAHVVAQQAVAHEKGVKELQESIRSSEAAQSRSIEKLTDLLHTKTDQKPTNYSALIGSLAALFGISVVLADWYTNSKIKAETSSLQAQVAVLLDRYERGYQYEKHLVELKSLLSQGK